MLFSNQLLYYACPGVPNVFFFSFTNAKKNNILYVKVGISWIDAQYECEVIGGFLAEPKTEAYLCLFFLNIKLKAKICTYNLSK